MKEKGRFYHREKLLPGDDFEEVGIVVLKTGVNICVVVIFGNNSLHVSQVAFTHFSLTFAMENDHIVRHFYQSEG